MRIPQLTSRDNPLLRTFRLVASGSRRAPKRLVLAEGVRILEEVEKSGHDIEAVVVSDGFGSPQREQSLCDRWFSRKIRVYQVTAKLLESISEVQTPQGAIALVHVPERDLNSVFPAPHSLLLFACGIQDPGNLGTIIRTAAAAGAAMVCTTKGTVSARNAKAIRSSAGAFFRIPVVEHKELYELQHYCNQHKIRLYRTDSREGVAYSEADLASSCAILLGNEGAGITGKELPECPSIRIPMAEGMDSLNVAVACGVILFEASRQRRLC
jgi:RNA methyltransferase, TrmH family